MGENLIQRNIEEEIVGEILQNYADLNGTNYRCDPDKFVSWEIIKIMKMVKNGQRNLNPQISWQVATNAIILMISLFFNSNDKCKNSKIYEESNNCHQVFSDLLNIPVL